MPRWLDAAHGLQVDLPAYTRDPRLDRRRYLVTASTSDLPQAGTDGEVFVQLVGAGGVSSSGWHRLGVAPAASEQVRGLLQPLRLQQQLLLPGGPPLNTARKGGWQAPCWMGIVV